MVPRLWIITADRALPLFFQFCDRGHRPLFFACGRCRPGMRQNRRHWGLCGGLTRSSSETFVGSKVPEELGHALLLFLERSRFCNGARIVRRVLEHLAATTAGPLRGGSHLSFAIASQE